MSAETRRSFIDAARDECASRCVGRSELKDRLLAALTAGHGRIVFLVGAGGIGKTSLARWLASCAEQRGCVVAWVSGEQVTPALDSFLAGVRVTSAGRGSERSPTESPPTLADLGRTSVRDLLVIDSFEKLAPLSRWILGDLLAELGPNVLVLVAGRERTSAAERARLGVLDVSIELEVGPLAESDARALLDSCAVSRSVQDEIVALAEGHPLALRLAAERGAGAALRPADRARVLTELVEAFVGAAPTRLHARALYAASVGRTLDETLLGAMVDTDDATALFSWLSRSAVCEQTPLGVSLHALVRNALFTELQLRAPELLANLQRRLVHALVPRMLATDLSSAHEWYMQAAFTVRNRASSTPYASGLSHQCSVVSLREASLPPVRDAVLRFEGAAGVASLEAWLRREAFSSVVVDGEGVVSGFQIVLRVPYDATHEHLTDPIIASVWRDWRASCPERGGDLFLFRWFADVARYQDLTPAMSHLFTLGPLQLLPRVPEVDHIGFAMSPPELWASLAPSFTLEHRGTFTDFGGRRYGHLFGSLRRGFEPGSVGPREALWTYLQHHLGLPPESAPEFLPFPSKEPFVAISRDELPRLLPAFLTGLEAPKSIAQSPIAEVLRRVGLASDAAAAVAWVEQSLDALASAPRTKRCAEVLRATYLSGSNKQVAAAWELGMPFGTYRYQLRKALGLLAAEMWPRLEPHLTSAR